MTVDISAVRPGMVLARAVVNETGVTLFGRGTEVTEAVIERLKNAGTALVTIEGRRLPARSREEEMRSLDERFAAVDKAPHMAGIKDMVRRHIESLYS